MIIIYPYYINGIHSKKTKPTDSRRQEATDEAADTVKEEATN